MKTAKKNGNATSRVPYEQLKSVTMEGKEYRLFDLVFLGTLYKIFFSQEKYEFGGFAVLVMDIDREAYETGTPAEECISIFSDGTKNLDPLDEEDEEANLAYADGNSSWLVQFITRHRLAKDTGYRTRSGYCTYPLMQWFPEKFLVQKRTKGKTRKA